MCGIYGWQFTEKQVTVTSERAAILAAVLGITMDGRGGDSWGVATAAAVTRGLGDIAGGYDFTTATRERWIMAHTRKATTGDVLVENSHPFHVTGAGGVEVIGAHNGIVWNHDTLNRLHSRTCAVDSMHLFAHVADDVSMSDVSAYGAVEYTRSDTPGRVYLSRFEGGELSVWGVTVPLTSDQSREKKSAGKLIRPEQVGIVWASTERAAKSALAAAGLTGYEYRVEQGALYYAENGVLMVAAASPFAAIERAVTTYYTYDHKTELDGAGEYRYHSGGSGGGSKKNNAPAHTYDPLKTADERISAYGIDPDAGKWDTYQKFTLRGAAAGRRQYTVESPPVFPATRKELREWLQGELTVSWAYANLGESEVRQLVAGVWDDVVLKWRKEVGTRIVATANRDDAVHCYKLAAAVDNTLYIHEMWSGFEQDKDTPPAPDTSPAQCAARYLRDKVSTLYCQSAPGHTGDHTFRSQGVKITLPRGSAMLDYDGEPVPGRKGKGKGKGRRSNRARRPMFTTTTTTEGGMK